MPHPLLNPAVALAPVDGGYLAYDAERDCLHELNASGALLAELCDGSRSVEAIRALAGPLLPAGTGGEVDRWIDAGVAAGLLVWGGEEPTSAHQLFGAELSQLAEHLFQSGRLDAALKCARRATELNPESSDAWHALGRMALAAGERGQSRAAYEQYLSYQPDDAAIRHVLLALCGEPPPARASDDCILQSFQEFSSYYDSKMREQLDYQAPERLYDLITAGIGGVSNLEILDIGCGTGLAGVGLKGYAARLVGIDLSPEMIERARARGIYDALEVAEITAWLEREQARFDLIVACDCLEYFGDLHPVVSLAAKRLKPGGALAFTVERGDSYPLRLMDTGRYTHHADHIREAAEQAGLRMAHLEEGFLRMEGGLEVTGLYVFLDRPGGA